MKTLKKRMGLTVFAMVFGLQSAHAASIEDVVGIPGGLAVLVGATDAKTALELASTERWITLVLAPTASEADKIQAAVHESGAAGLITVGVWDAKTLPLADHMGNLIVVDPAVRIDQDEVLRALVPVRGKTLVREGDRWKTFDKPMPENLDGWTHFFHGSDGNKVSRDDAFQVPNGLRFIAGPRLQDANGANGWRIDGGIAASEWKPTLEDGDRYHDVMMVEGRDAFNGLLLWQRVEQVHRGQWNARKTKPVILADGRLLRISDDGKENAKLAAFSPKTGELTRRYESSLNIRENQYNGRPPLFTYDKGVIYQCDQLRLRAIDAEADKELWTYEHDQGHLLARPIIARGENLVVVCEVLPKAKWGKTGNGIDGGRYPNVYTDALVAIDLKSGEHKWRCPVPHEARDFTKVEPGYTDRGWGVTKQKFHAITYKNGRIFCLDACDANARNPSAVWAVDAKTGQSLWFSACGPVGSKREMFDLFALDNGELFTYGHAWCRLDQATGKVLAYGSIGGNARCDTGACTANLVVAGFGNYFDLTGDALRWKRNDLARGQCGGWGTPAYGMVYHHGSGCGCFWPIRGNMALHHTAPPNPVANERRLTKGPAFDRPLGADAAEGDWPAYLHNGRRLAWGPKDGPRGLKEMWRVKVGEPIPHDIEGVRKDWLVNGVYNGPVTAPIMADGRVFVADRDRHRVVALDAKTGRQQWIFQAAGRVLTAPTYAKRRLIFGARDGCVYALDATTGELAWKFLAAPEQRYLLAYGQMESVWPVHGCLPVVDGTVIATAGYHAEADGGIWAWGLNLRTGDIVWERCLERMERPWQSFMPGKGGILGEIGVAEHELAQNDKNGGYRPTRVRNIDLPMYDDEVAFVANIPLSVADGAVAERGVRDALVIHGERFPFLDMEFERRSGPHGSGGIGVVLGGTKILGFRSGRRAIHNDKFALVAPNAGGYRAGPELYLLNASGLGKSEPKDRTPIATAITSVGAGADSLVAGGATAYVASEGNLTRPWGHDGKQIRPRPRWYKGEPIPGHIEAFSLPDGKQLDHIEVDGAVINNGLAVAGGRLYAVCEDGTVRCYE